MQIETRHPDDLALDPDNARTHSEQNLATITASLQKFGQRKPIVIGTDGRVLAGNGTVQAARRLGWTEIAVSIAPPEWDAAMAKAYALADNRTAELAAWDQEVLASQLIDLEVDGWDVTEFGFNSTGTGTNPYGVQETPHEQTPGIGLGTPIISFEIIFDTADQQQTWFEFLRVARAQHPEAVTNAERITAMLTDIIEGI